MVQCTFNVILFGVWCSLILIIKSKKCVCVCGRDFPKTELETNFLNFENWCIYVYIHTCQHYKKMLLWLVDFGCVCVLGGGGGGGGGGGWGGEVNWGESLNKKFATKFFFRIYKFLKTCKKIYVLIKLM